MDYVVAAVRDWWHFKALEVLLRVQMGRKQICERSGGGWAEHPPSSKGEDIPAGVTKPSETQFSPLNQASIC